MDNHIYCWGNNSWGQIGVGYAPGTGPYLWFPTPFQAKDPQ